MAAPDEPIRVCFVCLGNICRSPTAEAVMARLVDEAGLSEVVEIDSAGTGAWHVGQPPDDRAQAEAGRRGLTMTSRGRQFHAGDLDYFDLVVAMDRSNVADLRDLTGAAAHHDKIVLLRAFEPAPSEPDVPDPYYGGPDGFADVFDIVDAACQGLLVHVRSLADAR